MNEAELLSDIDPVLRRRDPNASEATSPLWVYCAGPMRGIAEFNFPAFEAATAQLRGLGYKVISPAEQDLGRGFDPSGLTGHEDLSAIGFDLREALIADLNHIAFECDAVCLLPGWENSSGAKAELALASALGLQAGTLEQFTAREPLSSASGYLYVDEQMRAPLKWFEPMTEHEYLHGSRQVSALDALVPIVWADAFAQAEKDRDAALARLDHFLTSNEALDELRVRYPMATLAVPAAGAVAARIGMTGPCDRRVPHDPHIETSGIVDNGGNIVLDKCPGQFAECANCEDRKCMDCVFRVIHDECRDDCPDCCNDLPAIIFPAEVRVTSETGGQKGAKLARFELIPTRPMWDVAELYGYGASKYQEARNWELGYDWSLSYAALQRHANLFWSREDDDSETGLPHLAAVVFHALALMEYCTTHPEFDDRPGQ